jgi:hypothetical protein
VAFAEDDRNPREKKRAWRKTDRRCVDGSDTVCSRVLILTGRAGTAPSGIDELVGQPVRMMDQCRQTLRTDIGFFACKPEDEDREVVFRSAAAETGNW